MIALLVSAIFVLLYNILFFKTNFWGVGFGLLILLLNLSFFLVRLKNPKYLWLGVASSITSTFFGLLVAWRANEIVQLLNAATSIVMAVVSVYFYKLHGVFKFKILETLLAPFVTLIHLPTALFGLDGPVGEASSGNEHRSKVSQSLLNGLFISIPVVGILALLLIQADPIFGKLTRDFLSSIIERALISAALFIGVFAFARVYIKPEIESEKVNEVTETKKGYEMMVVLGSVAVLFGIFIMVQFQYLFSRPDVARLQEVGIQSLTYSEYVRKGFFELLTVASLVIGMSAFIVNQLKKITGKEKILIQTFGGVVLFETGLILWSDWLRLQQYAIDNGLTRARIFGFIFLIYLAYLLGVMLIEYLQRVNQKQLFAAIVPVTLGVILSFSIVNIDGLIATRFKPTVNQETDYFYTTSLSADAYPIWKEALNDATKTLNELQSRGQLSGEDYRRLFYVRGTLRNIQARMQDIEGASSQWQSFNLSKDNADLYIQDNQELFNTVDELFKWANELDQKVDQNIRYTTPLDRDVTPPLIQ